VRASSDTSTRLGFHICTRCVCCVSGDVEVTCEEARTCGAPDPAANPAFEAEGYFVPWIGVPGSV
jgi:hypothetical protein